MKSGRTTLRSTPAGDDREERLKLAIASGRVGVWEYNLVSGELIWDDMMYDLYGMNPGEFGRSYDAWLERLHPQDRAGVEAAMEEALQGARDFSQEFRILWPNGETHHIKGHAQTVRNAAGKPIRLIGTTWDNQAYAQAQALLQHAFIAINKSKTAFFWVEPDGRVTDANDYACQSLGYSHDELVQLHIWDFDPDFPPQAVQAAWEAVKVEGIRIFETRHRRRDGSIFPVEITANYINFNGLEQTFCSVQNIAERKKIESALRLTQFVVDHSSVEVYRIDPAGHILYANEQACRGLGYTVEEMTQLTIPDIDPVVQQAEWVAHWRELCTQGSLFIETLHRRRDGSVRPVEVSANYFNYDGEEFNFAFVRDISERKQADLQIRRLTHLYKALTEVFQAIVRKEQATELFPLVCRCAVEFGGMKMAWVGQLDPQNGEIHPVASHGGWKNYLAEIRVSASAEVPEGNGPAGTALRENRTVIVNDFLTDPMTRPWQALAAKFGWGAAASFPIQHLGLPFAVLTVYHEQANAFDQEAIMLLDEMSGEIAFALDNHELEMQRQAAQESLRLAASVYETSSEAMMFTDADNRIISINPAFTTITGYSAEEAIGNTPRMLKSGRHDQPFYAAMWSQIMKTGHWQGEIWDRRRNGEVYLKWLTVNTVFKTDGAVQHRIALFTDITQKKASEKLIWKQANFDDLTELPNRHMFHDRLRQEIMKAHRSSQRLALLFIDLDRFKEINDTLGHAMGDSLLKEAARRLGSCIRESDTVARMGGDEFTVILGELDDPRVAERVAQEILQAIAQPFQIGDETAYVSASIGITLYPEDAGEIDELVKNADQAMYAAKNQGRNRYQYFTPSMQQVAQQRMRLATDLRAALAGGQFWIAYQPIVDLASGTIRKAEALLRWEHPQRGLVSPAEFIPIAEDTGLIAEIGDWVYREAARQVLQWRQRYHPEFQISVNKSPVQFYNAGGLHLDWQEHLKQLGLPGQSLAVEITEGLLLDASGEVVSSLLQFRDAGMQVSIDDFGTGYSSLAYLKKFDIDYLKIDQSFVRGLARDSNDMALCEAIVVMAHKLGIEVIAEGVETEEQKALLVEAGCDYAQGFLFSRPVRAAELEPLLALPASTLPATAAP